MRIFYHKNLPTSSLFTAHISSNLIMNHVCAICIYKWVSFIFNKEKVYHISGWNHTILMDQAKRTWGKSHFAGWMTSRDGIGTRWARTSYKWSYIYIYIFTPIDGLTITPINRVITTTLLITGSGGPPSRWNEPFLGHLRHPKAAPSKPPNARYWLHTTSAQYSCPPL